ncbi:MAG: radical SAM protein [Candidatus Omnitrophica bacterium]|nr:radical SAM protein [Candidatus Omnitrophota bacterium]
MKIIISYPPLADPQKGIPLLSQNRQFQYFKEPTYIYPVVPATAATMLKQAGHDVLWLDCIAEDIPYEKFISIIKEEKPDLIAFETKTPVVKQHWKIIDNIKCQVSGVRCVLFGDHVTALPQESFQNSQVDYVLTGGDYDFLLLNLCNVLERLRVTSYELRVTDLEPGIYYRQNGQIKNTGKFKLGHDLNCAPFIDRALTKWQLYAYKNGNYKRTPGTYIMSARDCWWGKCTFCSWPLLYPEFRLRQASNVLDEIGKIIGEYRVREIMDDSGTFPVGEWLRDFCQGMIKRGYHKKIYLDCNMRFGAISPQDYKLMKNAGFRLLLFGLESANQTTLERLNKNLKVETIIESCKLARSCGLYPHITIMFGYPWETLEQAQKTLELGSWLLKKGYAYTMQATVVIPYPGSRLFEECKKEGWLKSLDWDDYDMKQPIMQIPFSQEQVMEFAQAMYQVSFDPKFLLRKIFSLRDADDLKYLLRAGKKVFGHIFDFRKQ